MPGDVPSPADFTQTVKTGYHIRRTWYLACETESEMFGEDSFIDFSREAIRIF
jgi:hypothetical protein